MSGYCSNKTHFFNMPINFFTPLSKNSHRSFKGRHLVETYYNMCVYNVHDQKIGLKLNKVHFFTS